MSEKYYTPDKSEYHLGFRYEIGDKATIGKSTKWYNHIIDKLDFINDIGLYEEVRAKYLDKSDIEELGWEFITSEQGAWPMANYFRRDEYWLIHNIRGTRTVFICLSLIQADTVLKLYAGDRETLFYGTCKNYGELDKIMKQTKIV
jgi:hypothetical protein